MSQSVALILHKAQRHAKKGETDLAVQQYKRILQKYPQNKRAIAGLKALQRPERIKKAANPQVSQEQFNGLITLYNQGKLKQALDAGEALEKQFPSTPYIPNLLGAVNAGLGRLEQAVANYEKALAIKPDSAEAHNNLGNALRELGKLDEAVASYNKALQINPDFAEANNNLGNALKELGKPDKAVANYHKALSINPDYTEAHSNLGNALSELGLLDAAVASYYKALAINPDYTEAHNNLGNALQDLGKLDEAVASYSKALQINPDYTEAHNNLGNVLRELGRLDEAVASYNKALQINPDSAEAHNNLGNVLQDLGKLDEAVASYNKALQINPDSAEAHNNLGNALRELGKLDEAIACYHKALQINPDYGEAHRHLAYVKKFTKYDDDIKVMEEVYARSDVSDQQRMHLAFALGKAFEDLHQHEKAFGLYLTGNTIKRGTYEYSIKAAAKTIEGLTELFTTKLFNEHKTAGSSDETPIFILGMPRSGTTLVEQILASHTNVYGAGELNHLSRIVASRFTKISDVKLSYSLAQAGGDDFLNAGCEYISMIRENVDSAKFITDKMPLNFHHIGMIKLMLPKAKIIHCCRDARDTCLSIFKNYFSTDGNYYAFQLDELGLYYNLYRDLMAHWHSVLPGFIYDIHYEEIVANQEAQSRSLLSYCGLEWDDACLEFYNTDRIVKTASVTQVRKPIYQDSVRSWTRYENWLAPLLDVLADRQSIT